jgi:hypothetical protein
MSINTDYNSYYYNNQYTDQYADDELMEIRKQNGSESIGKPEETNLE